MKKFIKKIGMALVCAASVCAGSAFAKSVELKEAKLVLVGDSTVCAFKDAYLYPRYGYGTQIGNNLSEKITVVNCARSGRSSKSFVKETNYQQMKDNLSKGDYLMIAFGHNDQKREDTARFTDANGKTDDADSFKHYLYEYYVKYALDVGATPILCTPIVRANAENDYSGVYGHVTENGDYSKAVVELGKEKKVQVIDLTSLTKKLYKKIGFENAKFFHAIPVGNADLSADWASLDTTHLNIFGAKEVAYLFCKALKSSKCPLGKYVTNLYEPKKEVDLVKNENYKYAEYKVLDFENIAGSGSFETIGDWYGTAFGSCGESPKIVANGFVAKETSEGVFTVGQTAAGVSSGEIGAASDGFSFVCRQLPSSKNFTLSAKAKVLTVADKKYGKSAGFGLMLRDDCYAPSQSTVDSNYVAAGLYADSSSSVVNFSREGKALNLSSDTAPLYKAGDTAEFKIERVGQVVKVTTSVGGKSYTQTFTDFDFVAKDNAFIYAGLFGTRGTTVEFTDVVIDVTGESQVN